MRSIALSGFLPSLKFGAIEIPSYYITVSIATCAVVWWTYAQAKSKRFENIISQDLLFETMAVLMVSGFVGARLLHVFLEEWSYYLERPLEIFSVWRGGFVWYGGASLSFLVTSFWLKRRQEKLLKWYDFFAPSVALGYGLGRLACLLAGCCYGSYCDISEQLSIQYPTQAFAIAWELCSFQYLRSLKDLKPGKIFFKWLILHSSGRLIMEAMRADPRGPMLGGLSPATYISFILLVIGLLAFFKAETRK
jgi:phosphatidylglycerol---prolipoprotein diacylglyceryl transferase